MSELWVSRLGRVDYEPAAALQERLRDAVRDGEMPEMLLLLEHPPVYTRGRRSEPGELPMGEDFYRAKGIDIVRTRRGGKVTYHGPGQLVGYPIVRVEDVRAYVCAMQQAIVTALAAVGVAARVRDGWEYTGAWVGERKIASVGVHVSRGVSTHGFAVNVDCDLAPFDWIIPCGLSVPMTSVAAETGRDGLSEPFAEAMVDAFSAAIGRTPVAVPPERIAPLTPAA